ncbi:MAG: 2-amino-4-hydroxy-6-hydroxymethyldihydropteridine diphosphokinase [Paludibacteraceae bacterium]|nr:2-amino-4-hydroxy-6-hydroxymethyldihydropteridine diphosphokinase [Paludibacteraceae bacterium]
MIVYLSLGANLGNREQTIQQAIDRLAAEAGKVLAQSSLFYSEPWGFRSEHRFCNCCVKLQTALSPIDLLRLTQRIERSLGREKKSGDAGYSDRTIDIDLIRAFDEQGNEICVHSPELTLPHPLWTQRDFVRLPLAEIT